VSATDPSKRNFSQAVLGMRLRTLQLAYVFAASLFTALAQVNLKRQFLRNELETLLKEDGPNRTDAVPVLFYT